MIFIYTTPFSYIYLCRDNKLMTIIYLQSKLSHFNSDEREGDSQNSGDRTMKILQFCREKKTSIRIKIIIQRNSHYYYYVYNPITDMTIQEFFEINKSSLCETEKKNYIVIMYTYMPNSIMKVYVCLLLTTLPHRRIHRCCSIKILFLCKFLKTF